MTQKLTVIRPPNGPIPRLPKPNLRGYSRTELADWIKSNIDGPSYRANQVWQWIHRDGATSFDAMTNLSKALREKLGELACLDPLEVADVLRSSDGTRKLRLRSHDGSVIESVLIPNDDRGYTLCVSSQVGCALTCRFCATASLGFIRNLDTWEIVDQVYRAASELSDEPKKITNLVYMGMGEPLHNFNHVKRSIGIVTDNDGLDLGQRRVTVSTSGLVPGIERFARESLGKDVRLAISLNATTDEVRNEIMPINTRWSISELLDAVEKVPADRRRELTIEYVLLADVNDTDADARRLVKLTSRLPCHVNVIPFNPHSHAPYRRPSQSRVNTFVRILRAANVAVFVRTPRGDDVGAACGQLALDAGSLSPTAPATEQ